MIRLASSGSARPWLSHPAVKGVGMSLLESIPAGEWWPRRSPLAMRAGLDPDTSAAVVDLSGRLTRATVPVVRATLLSCFALCPTAVVVRTAAMVADRPAALTVFPATQRCAVQAAHVPLVLCGPTDRLDPGVLGPDVPIYDDCADALSRIGHGALGRGVSQLHLPATSAAAAQARQHVREACRAWTLDHLTDPAELIVTELVSNAVLHAGTPVDLMLTRRHRFLHLAVRDADPTPPRVPSIDPATAERGRGLRLIDTYASGWGSLTSRSSKIVWAKLRVSMPSPRATALGTGYRRAQPADR